MNSKLFGPNTFSFNIIFCKTLKFFCTKGQKFLNKKKYNNNNNYFLSVTNLCPSKDRIIILLGISFLNVLLIYPDIQLSAIGEKRKAYRVALLVTYPHHGKFFKGYFYIFVDFWHFFSCLNYFFFSFNIFFLR